MDKTLKPGQSEKAYWLQQSFNGDELVEENAIEPQPVNQLVINDDMTDIFEQNFDSVEDNEAANNMVQFLQKLAQSSHEDNINEFIEMDLDDINEDMADNIDHNEKEDKLVIEMDVDDINEDMVDNTNHNEKVDKLVDKPIEHLTYDLSEHQSVFITEEQKAAENKQYIDEYLDFVDLKTEQKMNAKFKTKPTIEMLLYLYSTSSTNTENKATESDHSLNSEKNDDLPEGYSYTNLFKEIGTRFICGICSKSYSNKTKLKVHFYSHVLDKHLYCSICCKRFISLRSLQTHVDLEHGHYQCDTCSKRFSSKYRLITHIKNHFHEANVDCNQCKEKFHDKSDLRDHLQKVHNGCFEYVKKSKKTKGLPKRITNESNTQDLPHVTVSKSHSLDLSEKNAEKCHSKDIPELTVNESPEKELADFQDSTTNEIPSKDLLELAVNKDSSEYLPELTESHLMDLPATTADENCANQTTNGVMNEDQEIQIKRRNSHKCTVCNKEFKNACHLKRHMFVHSDYCLFTCSLCKRGFKRSDVFQNHLITVHNGKKSFQCDVCKKLFAKKQYLEKHKLRHSSVKNFSCSICVKRYRSQGDLSKHIKKVHVPKLHEDPNFVNCDKLKTTYAQFAAENKCDAVEIFRESLSNPINQSKGMFENGRSVDEIAIRNSEESNSIQDQDDEKSFATNKISKELGTKGLSGSSCLCFTCGNTYKTERGLKHHISSKHSGKSKTKIVSVDPETAIFALFQETFTKRKTAAKGGNSENSVSSDTVVLENTKSKIHDTIVDSDNDLRSKDSGNVDINRKVYEAGIDDFDKNENQRVNKEDITCITKTTNVETVIASEDDLKRVKNVDEILEQSNTVHVVNSQQRQEIASANNSNVCRICGRMFSCPSFLKTHMILHCEKMPHVCTVCEKGFPRLESLKIHMINAHTGIKSFECDICKKSFARKFLLNSHKVRHTNIRNFQCNICLKKSKTKHDLQKHMRRHNHSQIQTPGRKSDLTGYEDLGVGNSGINANEGESRNGDNYVNERSVTIDDKENLTDTDVNILSVTEANGNRRRRIYPKIRTKQGQKDSSTSLTCEICQITFSKLYHRRRHSILHNDIFPHTCSVCDKGCSRKDQLKLHMINAHSGEKTFECEVCNKAFATKNDLKNHKARHVNVRNFQCDLCTKTFKTKHDRDKHAKRSHAKVSKSQDKSDLTPAMRNDEDSLEVGLSGLEAREKIANKAQGHNEGKINKADDDTIGVSFDSDSNLNRATDLDSDERTAHMLTDVMDNCVKSSELLKSKKSQDRTGINGVSDKENATAVDNVDCVQTIEIHDVASQLKDKQCQRVTKNSCKICHKTFTSDGNFKRHMYSHSDTLPYTCSVCKKGFPRTDYLNIHVINVHTGKKLFECDVCKRTFATNHYMKKHRISHTKLRQFKCGTCEKTYKNRSDVRKHIKAKHLLSKSSFSKSDTLKTNYIHFEDDTGENDNDVVDNGLENQIEELDEERDRNLNKEKNSDQEDRNANNDLAKTSNGIDYRSSKYTEEDTDQEKAFEIKSNCNNITVELKQKEKAPNVLGKQFSCEICKKEFASRKGQKRHQLLHSNTLPFTCSSCGKGFPRKEALHLHTVSAHGGKKDFQCEICKKSFATKNYLINHRLIHSLERKFPCQFCKKSSKTHTDLIKHVKRIHPEKLSKNFTVQKHTCQFCGTNSKTNGILLRHIKRMHPKEFKK